VVRDTASRAGVGVVLVVVAACSAATPSASAPTSTPRDPTSIAPAPTSSHRPSARPTPSGALAAQIEIASVDPGLTHPIGEFRSDGQMIVYASARASDAGPDGTPDLWRLPLPEHEPELLWRNPERSNSIVVIAGDLGTYAFVDMPLTGERAWNLWILPRGAGRDGAVLLDTHPGDEDVSSLVPSVAVYEDSVVWTAFDRGASGAVSQLRVAQGPDWEPRTIREVPAADAELWFPSLLGSTLAYVEVRYLDGRTDDERHVYLGSTAPGTEPRRLDRSGLATMPVLIDDGVLWKEAEEGFSMMNWGRMYHHDIGTGVTRRLRTSPQQWVNYPSAGARFGAWWGADSFQLGVYDFLLDEPRVIARHSHASQTSDLRPHLAGDLLTWIEVVLEDAEERSELRYAFLPGPRDP
jgi:hypothetical protein